MKTFNKILAGSCAVAIAMSMAACSKTQLPEDTTAESGNAEITIAVDNSEETTEATTAATDATSDSEEVELPMTNENGEYTVEGATFDTMYGSQIANYLNHQYYYDDVAIPIAESNFYFIHEFTSLSQDAYYGSYPVTSEGFVDLAYVFENGQLENFTFNTFGDFYREFTENQILSTYIVLDLAAEEGITLPEERQVELDEYMATIEELAAAYGLGLDDYLKIFYGPDCDAEAFRGILERYYLSTEYSENYIANYQFDEEELYVPKVCHALFMARDGVATDEELKAAKAAAEDMLAQCKTADDVLKIGGELNTTGEVAECASYAVEKNLFVEEFEDWAYESGRQENDLGIVKTVFGYHVMGYMGLDEIDEASKRSIAVQALNDEIGAIAFSEVHDFYTPDEIITPDPVDPVEETEETTIPTINLDEDGNLIVETTATNSSTVDGNSIVPDEKNPAKEDKPKAIANVAIGVGVIALVAAICLIITSLVKGKKNDSEDVSDDVDSIDSEDNE